MLHWQGQDSQRGQHLRQLQVIKRLSPLGAWETMWGCAVKAEPRRSILSSQGRPVEEGAMPSMR